MPRLTAQPAWQSQAQFENYTYSLRGNSMTSRESMLGSLFKRKNSTTSRPSTSPITTSIPSSTSSTTSNTPSIPSRASSISDADWPLGPGTGSRLFPAELSADVAGMTLSEATTRPRSRGESSPLSSRSPPTRRPDRPGMNAFTVPSNEPPPAYTETPITPSGPISPVFPGSSHGESTVSPRISLTAPEEEDKYAFLTQFDTVLLIDDSGSMAGRSWRETNQALSQLLPIVVNRDADGIDIFFLNHVSSDPGNLAAGIAAGGYRNVKTVEEVHGIFNTVRPQGGTPTGTRCRAILKPYLTYLEAQNRKGKIDEVKPLNVLVITDGVPSDDVEAVLLQTAKKLDALDAAPHQVGVQFFQVGNEEGAAEALRELDDGLVELVRGGVRDIVDTCTWMGGSAAVEGEDPPALTADGLLKCVLGAVVRRLDRRRCIS